MPAREHAELLLRKAAQDEYLLDMMLNDPQAPIEAFGFHAQQAAEKLFKSLLALRGVAYRPTHRIADLLDLLRDQGIQVPAELEMLRILTPFAVEFRYDALPEESEEPLDKHETREGVRALRRWVECQL